MKNFYNIHDFIKVAIDSGKSDLIHGYEHYLRQFKRATDNSAGADYTVKDFSDFKLPEPHFSAGDSFLGFKDGIYFPGEKYAITLEAGKITEYTTYANRATNLWTQTLLLKKGLSFVHSLGVEIDGKGLIFPAFGGVGKTLLASELRKQKEFKFFGDDFVIINGEATMYSYPADFSIYDYHLQMFPELKSASAGKYLKRRKILAPYFILKRIINFAAKRLTSSGEPFFSGWNANHAKVPADNLIPKEKIGAQSELQAGIFLSRYNGSEIKLQDISLDRMSQAVTGILNLEFGSGLPYLHALEASGNFDTVEFENNQQKIIRQCFSKIKLYHILIPQGINVRNYCEQVTSLIKNKILPEIDR